MAVINEPGSIKTILADPAHAIELIGTRGVIQRKIVLAGGTAEDDGSKWVLGVIRGIARILSMELEHDVITAGTVYDVGLYFADGTIVTGKDNVFANDLDLSAASPKNAFSAVALADRQKFVWEHAGHVDKTVPASGEVLAQAAYLIVLTGVTVGSGAGSILSKIRYRTW